MMKTKCVKVVKEHRHNTYAGNDTIRFDDLVYEAIKEMERDNEIRDIQIIPVSNPEMLTVLLIGKGL